MLSLHMAGGGHRRPGCRCSSNYNGHGVRRAEHQNQVCFCAVSDDFPMIPLFDLPVQIITEPRRPALIDEEDSLRADNLLRKRCVYLFVCSCAELAPQVGLEPTTLRLTAGCSAIELLRSVVCAAFRPRITIVESLSS